MTDQDLRRRNLAFLEKSAGEFHAALMKSPKAPVGRPAPALADGPPAMNARIVVEPPLPEGRHPYLTRFITDLIQAAREREIPQFPTPTFTLASCLVVIGSVNPAGLDTILRQTGCVLLIVVVPDPAAFRAQLDQIDWSAVDAQVRSRGGQTFFRIARQPETIAAAVNLTVSAHAPFALDGLTVAAFDGLDLARAAFDTLSTRAYRALSTLGTFYDGCLMLKNSEINLRRGKARLYRNKPGAEPPDLPAWIVGSGPSLDGDLAFLKANQETAVIISCGSALAALLAAGITPDVHVELENVEVASTLNPARSYDLSSITLFAPASVDPVALDGFRETVFSFRQNLPNQPLYGVGPSALTQAGEPTVVNLALAFAREQGFPQVCFFGVDMGTRDPTRDHADGTWHSDLDSDYDTVDHPHVVPANFGGDCMTTTGLNQALHALAVAVALDREKRDYVNCSDGAAIAGARPLHAAELAIAPSSRPKGETVTRIVQSFDTWNPADMPRTWPGPAMMPVARDLLAAVRDDLRAIGDFGQKGYIAVIGERLRFYEGHLRPAPPGPESAARMLVRGAVGSLILFLEYYLNRVTSRDHLAQLGTAAVPILERELTALEADMESWIGGPEIGELPDFRGLLLPADAKFFEPPAVPRNAPCPCGSGKRFKQCHGRAA